LVGFGLFGLILGLDFLVGLACLVCFFLVLFGLGLVELVGVVWVLIWFGLICLDWVGAWIWLGWLENSSRKTGQIKQEEQIK